MPSPFPGMDPWLEYHWGDVHTRFVTYAADALQPHLPPDLRVRIEERVAVEGAHEDERQIVPDLRIVETPVPSQRERLDVSGIAVAEPVLARLPDEPVTERYIEIREFRGGPLITVIELLSPTNKSGGGKTKYNQKRREFARAGVTLVEIDLIRQGDDPWYADAGWYDDAEPYHVAVRPGWDPTELQIYPIGLRQPLPTFRVPLRYNDRPALLALQSVLTQCYIKGDYNDIDYSEAPPGPPLSAADHDWVANLLQQAGRH
jgi:hypothetical protein